MGDDAQMLGPQVVSRRSKLLWAGLSAAIIANLALLVYGLARGGEPGRPAPGASGSDASVAEPVAPLDAAPFDPAHPPPTDLVEAPTLAEVRKNRWVAFGGSYWRLFGGALVGSQPKSVSAARSGALYISNTGFHDRENVHRLDPTTLAVVARANFAGNAVEQVLSRDEQVLYVSNFYHQEVLALDATTLRVRRRFRVGQVPKHLAVSPDGKWLYASNWDSGTTTIVDLDTGKTDEIAVGREPRGTAVSADGTQLYVVNFDSDTISVIDLATRTVTRTLGDLGCDAPRHVVVTRDDRWLLVSCYHDKHVLVLDRVTGEVARRVPVGDGPKTVDVSFDGRFAYTADYQSHSMSIIDLTTWASQVVPLPLWRASGLAVASDDRHVYVTGWDSRSLVIVQRWLPGDDLGPPSPKQPTGACLRTKKRGC